MNEFQSAQPKITLLYDIEVFKNFFSALFMSEDMELEYIFYKHGDRDDTPALIQFISQPGLTLVGYNSLWYDDIILKFILSNPGVSNLEIYNASKKLIETKNRRDLPDRLKEAVYMTTPWRSADMLALLRMNRNAPGLKHCAIHLEHGKLQDLPKKPNEKVKTEEIPVILRYNRNDVIITGRLWHNKSIQEAIYVRDVLGKQYGIDLISADDSRLGNVILETVYGVPDAKGTKRKLIHGNQLIPPGLTYKTEIMQNVLQAIEKLTLIETETRNGGVTHLTFPRRKRFEHVFEFAGTKYTMAKGGLHSDDQPRILRSDKEYIYRDSDVGSYYPALRQRYKLVPAHLNQELFLAADKQLIETRLTAKANGDKPTAEGLKICINGIFGKYNYPFFWLYDPLPFYQTTIFGQLLLLKLIEMLHLAGIETVSANTDGIVCKMPRDKEDVYFATCIEWQKQTGMTLEYTDYSFLVQLNVNSYMSHAVQTITHGEDYSLVYKPADKVKTKKDFSDNKLLEKPAFIKGYSAPIVAIALQNYYKDGVSPEETINSHENIHNFLYTQKTGGKFELWERWPDGKEQLLQKTNRYYITKGGSVLVKKDTTDYAIANLEFKSRVSRETSIWKGHCVHILNNVKKDRPKVDRQFYISKVYDIINKIEPPKKLDIFDFI